jgi:PUA domain protein
VVELASGREILLVNGKPLFLKLRDGIFPTLASLEQMRLKRVVVDMGAVPHVAKGADVMAPGVVSVGRDIRVNEAVVVANERHGKPLAIGLALVPGEEMKRPKGKVVKNLHHVGDEVWRFQEKVK